jgi:hypothetical protein
VSRLSIAVYTVDARTLKRGPILRHVVVQREPDPALSASKRFLDQEPPCRCPRCADAEKQ